MFHDCIQLISPLSPIKQSTSHRDHPQPEGINQYSITILNIPMSILHPIKVPFSPIKSTQKTLVVFGRPKPPSPRATNRWVYFAPHVFSAILWWNLSWLLGQDPRHIHGQYGRFPKWVPESHEFQYQHELIKDYFQIKSLFLSMCLYTYDYTCTSVYIFIHVRVILCLQWSNPTRRAPPTPKHLDKAGISYDIMRLLMYSWT